jgi:hypothetical protein
MPLDISISSEVILSLENFIEAIRPEEEIRSQLDYFYKIENQSIIILSKSPFIDDKNKIIETPIAKTTYVQKTKKWKIFWWRAIERWDPYTAKPTVDSFDEFIDTVAQDEHYCFFG